MSGLSVKEKNVYRPSDGQIRTENAYHKTRHTEDALYTEYFTSPHQVPLTKLPDNVRGLHCCEESQGQAKSKVVRPIPFYV